MGMFGIFMSFPPSFLLHYAVYGEVMSFMTIASVWVILGIGADDVFVFWDMWKEAPKRDMRNRKVGRHLRMAYTFRKATSAMLATSFTSAAAFYSNAFSDIPPISQFGFFLGNLVCYNYLLVVTWVPAMVVSYDRWRKIFSCCDPVGGCRRAYLAIKARRAAMRAQKAKGLTPRGSAQPGPGSLHRLGSMRASLGSGAMAMGQSMAAVALAAEKALDPVAGVEADEEEEEALLKQTHVTVRILEGSGDWMMEKYFYCMYKGRYLVLLLSVIFVAIMGSQIPKIKSPEGVPQLFPDDHNIQLLNTITTYLDTSGRGKNQGASSSGSVTVACPAGGCPTVGSGSVGSSGPSWPTLDGLPFPIYPLARASNQSDVLSKPGAPTNLVLASPRGDIVVIEVDWASPQKVTVPIDYYTVARGRAVKVDGVNRVYSWDSRLTSTQLPGQASVTLTGISHSMWYGVRVVAHNVNGYGFVSDVVFIRVPSPYPGPSLPVSIASTAPWTINFKWKDPVDPGSRAVIGFQPQYSYKNPFQHTRYSDWHNAQDFLTLLELGENREYTFEEICAGADVYVRALAVNSMGPSIGDPDEGTDWLKITMSKNVPFAPQVKVDTRTYSSLGITLVRPECTGGEAITSLNYAHFTADIPAANIKNLPTFRTVVGDGATVIISSLPANQTIYIFARANNAPAFAPSDKYWTTITAKTKTVEPDPPDAADINVTILGTSSIRLDWLPPAYKGNTGTIAKYRIEYTDLSSVVTAFTTAAETYLELTGLKGATNYYFSIRASNDGTEYGDASPRVIGKTLTQAPLPPTSLVFRRRMAEYNPPITRRVLLDETTSLQEPWTSAYPIPTKAISWSPPTYDGGAPVTGYQFRQQVVQSCNGSVAGPNLTDYWYPFTVSGCTSGCTYNMVVKYGSYYSIGVRAFNGAYSDWVTGCVSRLTFKPEPPNVTFPAQSIFVTQVTLKWAPGFNNAEPITTYEVAYSVNNGAMTSVTGLTTTSYIISNLAPNTKVYGCVSARNVQGLSSQACANATSQAAGMLEVTELVGNAINISMSPYDKTKAYVAQITFKNVGQQGLTFSATLKGDNLFPWSQTSAAGLNTGTSNALAAGASLKVNITYSQTVYYKYQHTINITHSGVNPAVVATVYSEFRFPELVLGEESITVAVAKGASLTRFVSFQNAGNDSLQVSIPIVGGAVSYSAVPPTFVVAAGGSQSVRFVFSVSNAYSGAADVTQAITITMNPNRNKSLPLTSFGTFEQKSLQVSYNILDQELRLQSTSVNAIHKYNSSIQGARVNVTVPFSTSGNRPLQIFSVSFSGALGAYRLFTITSCSNCSSGIAHSVILGFNMTTSGAQSVPLEVGAVGTLTITHDGALSGDPSPVTVAVSVVITKPVPEMRRGSLSGALVQDLAIVRTTVRKGQPGSETLFLKNIGNGLLELYMTLSNVRDWFQIRIDGIGPLTFPYPTSPNKISVSPGSSISIQFSFPVGGSARSLLTQEYLSLYFDGLNFWNIYFDLLVVEPIFVSQGTACSGNYNPNLQVSSCALRVNNTGGFILDITSVQSSGTLDCSVTNSLPLQIQALGFANLNVAFTLPNSPGFYQCFLKFFHSGDDGNTTVATNFTLVAAPALQIPNGFVLSSTLSKGSPKILSFPVTNTGFASGSITNVVFGTGASNFDVSFTTTTVPLGQTSVSFTVTAKLTAVLGALSGSLTVSSNAPNAPSLSVSFSLSIVEEGFSLFPNTYGFGRVLFPSTSGLQVSMTPVAVAQNSGDSNISANISVTPTSPWISFNTTAAIPRVSSVQLPLSLNLDSWFDGTKPWVQGVTTSVFNFSHGVKANTASTLTVSAEVLHPVLNTVSALAGSILYGAIFNASLAVRSPPGTAYGTISTVTAVQALHTGGSFPVLNSPCDGAPCALASVSNIFYPFSVSQQVNPLGIPFSASKVATGNLSVTLNTGGSFTVPYSITVNYPYFESTTLSFSLSLRYALPALTTTFTVSFKNRGSADLIFQVNSSSLPGWITGDLLSRTYSPSEGQTRSWIGTVTGQGLTPQGQGTVSLVSLKFMHNAPADGQVFTVDVQLTMRIPKLVVSDVTPISQTFQNWITQVVTVRTVTLQNTGNEPLSLSSLTFTSDWLQVEVSGTSLPTSVPNGGSVSLVFKFNMNVNRLAGVYNDVVTLTHSSPVDGSKTTWNIAMILDAQPVFLVTPITEDMVQSVDNTDTDTETSFFLSFVNNGRSLVTFSSVVISYGLAVNSQTNVTNLYPGPSVQFSFSVAIPTALNSPKLGNISFYHNGAINQANPLVIPFAVYRGMPILTVNPSHTFDCHIGSPPLERTIRIRNDGQGPLNMVFSIPPLVGYQGWMELNVAVKLLQPGKTFDVPVTFDTVKFGNDVNSQVTLRITAQNGTVSTQRDVSVSLNPLEPQLTINPSYNTSMQVKGEGQASGQFQRRELLSNTGTYELTIESIVVVPVSLRGICSTCGLTASIGSSLPHVIAVGGASNLTLSYDVGGLFPGDALWKVIIGHDGKETIFTTKVSLTPKHCLTETTVTTAPFTPTATNVSWAVTTQTVGALQKRLWKAPVSSTETVSNIQVEYYVDFAIGTAPTQSAVAQSALTVDLCSGGVCFQNTIPSGSSYLTLEIKLGNLNALPAGQHNWLVVIKALNPSVFLYEVLSVSVFVYPVPNPPIITAVAEPDLDLVLSWQDVATTPTLSILEYNVTYQQQDCGSCLVISQINPAGQKTITFQALWGKTYRVTVTAFNSRGASQPAVLLTQAAQTPPDPVTFEFGTVSEFSVELVWRPKFDQYVTAYLVQYIGGGQENFWPGVTVFRGNDDAEPFKEVERHVVTNECGLDSSPGCIPFQAGTALRFRVVAEASEDVSTASEILDIVLPTCQERGCQSGVCWRNGANGDEYCTCFPNWFGIDCSKTCPSEGGKTCSNHGTCVFNVTSQVAACECAGQYVGPKCRDCDLVCPSNSYCVYDPLNINKNVNNLTCICPPGFLPSTNLNAQGYPAECLPCPTNGAGVCSNHGTCVRGPTSKEPTACHCELGYAGAKCEKECPSRCSGRGTCNETTLTCTCPISYVGDVCQLHCPVADSTTSNANDQVPCNGVGKCVERASQAVCECGGAYVGAACSVICPGVIEKKDANGKAATPDVSCNGRGTCVLNQTSHEPHCNCSYSESSNKQFEGSACQYRPGALANGLISAGSSIQLVFLWGVLQVDKSTRDKSNPSDPGSPIWDQGFNMALESSQSFLLDFCNALIETDRIRTGNGDGTECWIQPFAASQKVFPVEESKFYSVLMDWLASSGRGYKGSMGINETNQRVIFVMTKARTYLRAGGAGQDLVGPLNEWAAYMDKAMANASIHAPSMKRGFMACDQWPRVTVELAFIDGITMSIILSVSTSLTAMILFTGNLIIAFMGTLILLAVMIVMLGMFAANELRLGPIEVVSLSLIIGLAVDYCLHLGHAYMESKAGDRQHRIQHAVVLIGSSLIGASMTTMGSMMVLLLCTIKLFVTIGTIISLTVFMALIMSLGTFAAWLAVMGPNGKWGDLRSVVHCEYCLHKWRERRPLKYKLDDSRLDLGQSLEKQEEDEALAKEKILPFDFLTTNGAGIDDIKNDSDSDGEDFEDQRYLCSLDAAHHQDGVLSTDGAMDGATSNQQVPGLETQSLNHQVPELEPNAVKRDVSSPTPASIPPLTPMTPLISPITPISPITATPAVINAPGSRDSAPTSSPVPPQFLWKNQGETG
eukprot:g1906.t1